MVYLLFLVEFIFPTVYSYTSISEASYLFSNLWLVASSNGNIRQPFVEYELVYQKGNNDAVIYNNIIHCGHK